MSHVIAIGWDIVCNTDGNATDLQEKANIFFDSSGDQTLPIQIASEKTGMRIVAAGARAKIPHNAHSFVLQANVDAFAGANSQ